MTLDELVDQLQKVYGAQLHSVVLYGSAAAGEHIPKRSDYNVLVIVDELTMEHMRAGAAVARAWGEDGNPPPLTLTQWSGAAAPTSSRWNTPTSSSGIACCSARRRSTGSRSTARNLRLQLEHEAMGKLLKLRQGVLRGRRRCEGADRSCSRRA